MAAESHWAGKRVGVVGLGRSNLALIRHLLQRGAVVEGLDQKGREELGPIAAELEALGVKLSLGPGYLEELGRFEALALTPGMRKDLPQLVAARARGVEFTCEMQVFLQECPAPVVGITGTAGKTTTSTLVARVLSLAGRRVHLGGNIGTPLVDQLESIRSDDLVVLEMSSFQLELVTRSPNVAALLNLSPDHLDIHGSYRRYVEAKTRIFQFQRAGDEAVFNYDQEETRQLAVGAPAGLCYFSLERRLERGAFISGNRAVWAEEGRVTPLFEISQVGLPGRHNLANCLAAAAIATLLGIGSDPIARAVADFRGVPHRLEEVGEIGGVRFVNDSIATNPFRTLAALEALSGPVILLLGGYDKGVDFAQLARRAVNRARVILVFGQAAPKLAAAVERFLTPGTEAQLTRCRDLEEAFWQAWSRARPGDTILLSPACASYDAFRNFEERGERFRHLVRAIMQEGPR
mgnify:CR=1 FL=1